VNHPLLEFGGSVTALRDDVRQSMVTGIGGQTGLELLDEKDPVVAIVEAAESAVLKSARKRANDLLFLPFMSVIGSPSSPVTGIESPVALTGITAVFQSQQQFILVNRQAVNAHAAGVVNSVANSRRGRN
jgi:hypothetical protein